VSEATDTRQEVERLREERARLWEQLHEERFAEREIERLQAQIRRMETSLSWRITRPLRDVKTQWHKVKRRLAQNDG
jgi:predicted RNase H-like nuclease (RuvC/YqgF family)